jgi:two-component system, sensor histidine kinase and response regulator
MKPWHPLILIIDDETTIRDGCTQALEKSGCRVLTAQNGVEGLRIAREEEPAVAFIDLNLPGISGMSVIEILAREAPDIVSIMITGFASIVSAVEAIQKGAYDYIPKPFSPDQLRVITRRALDHQRLKVETRKLRAEKERMEKNFITFVSQEMRSPLVVIRQYMEVLKTVAGDGFKRDAAEIYNRCRVRIQDLETMIEHWLDISRIEEDTFAGSKVPLALSRVIECGIDEMAYICREKGIILDADVDRDLPEIIGDEESLVRVITNIIGNAAKYTPRNGRIKITARSGGDRNVTVFISDTGSGIPAEKLSFVFEPFFRVRGGEEQEPGSGLGLTFCKKVMDAHNGEIDVVSKEGQGTTFFLKFPVPPQAEGGDADRVFSGIEASRAQG